MMLFLFLLPFGLYELYNLKTEREKLQMFDWARQKHVHYLAYAGLACVVIGMSTLAILQNSINPNPYIPPSKIELNDGQN